MIAPQPSLARVAAVVAGSIAEEIGLLPGDVVAAGNGGAGPPASPLV
ncbi:MAG TPA: hypothetical protein PK794_07090 [Armatimonadota bacterium]|nr:hypothetical protein [Armatimonadota bacterium]